MLEDRTTASPTAPTVPSATPATHATPAPTAATAPGSETPWPTAYPSGYAVVDVETTGASADFGHKVIELGIVRVEAGRLRMKLQQYYHGVGRNDSIVMS